MHFLSDLKHVIDPQTLLTQFGYIGLFLAICAESGLLIGFFLPGDSLLLVAGVAAAAGKLHVGVLVILVFIAAFLGDQGGYWLGRSFGRRLFQGKSAKLFKPEYIEKSEAFFAKHGSKAVILARFVPIVRAFTPALAGIGNMAYATFISFDLVGALLWGVGMTLLGYYVGNLPFVEKYLNYLVLLIIIVSFIPVALEFARHKRAR